jgi:ferrous iron transport protein B
MSSTATIALAGNPNSGKTTLFNALTGARQRVGNYPGITVERKEGYLHQNETRVKVIDLPGCYSLSSYSQEELVARQVIIDERPDIIIDILDATRLERHLYLAVQFLEIGIPVVLVLNMMDEANKQGLHIDGPKLSTLLKCPVVETVARSGQGKQAAIQAALDHPRIKSGAGWEPLELSYGSDLDLALAAMVEKIEGAGFLTDRYPARWTALKYLERDEEILAAGRRHGGLAQELEAIVEKTTEHCRKTLNTNPEGLIADYRYGLINAILRQDVLIHQPSHHDRIDLSTRIDSVLTNRMLGPIIMLSILYAMFQITFTLGEIPMGWLEGFFGWLGDSATAIIPDGLVQSLVVSGIIDGVGGVMGFVPLIAVMFLLISFLEDSGYMARVAYMLDRVLRIFGLHGCSAMPFIISGGIMGGCAVPGVMATRTLRSPKEKLATLITAPFMPCGAKLPVFLLLIAAFFSENEAQIMFLITLFAWMMALLVSWFLRSTLIKGEPTPFVMELPPYRMPTLQGVLIHTWERVWQYIKKAGTVILAVSILLWAAMTFPGLSDQAVNEFALERKAVMAAVPYEEERELQIIEIDNREAQAALQHSLAGRVGSFFEPISQWAGFDWRTNIALVGGFAAKEVVVSTLGTAYSLGEVDPEETGSLTSQIAADPTWSRATALSLIVFVLIYAPCFVTVVAMAKESSWRWAIFSTIFNTALGFTLAVLVFQLSSRLLI